MPKTVSVHNGSAANREHNRRNPRTTGQMPHIQQDLVHHNETWIDIPVREAYKQIFQTAVDDYNRRQSRPERKIRDYYNQIRKSAKKHTAYELIIQIGDKNDTGLSADNEIAFSARGIKNSHDFIGFCGYLSHDGAVKQAFSRGGKL